MYFMVTHLCFFKLEAYKLGDMLLFKHKNTFSCHGKRPIKKCKQITVLQSTKSIILDIYILSNFESEQSC